MADMDPPAASETSLTPVRQPQTMAMALVIGALVLVAVILLGQAIAASQVARNQIRSSTQINAALGDALNTGIDAESGLRGFLLTQDETYLEPYAEGARVWPEKLDTLESLIRSSDRLDQLETLDQLRQLSSDKMEEMSATLTLYSTGDVRALLDLVQSSLGKQLMDEYRDVTSGLRGREQILIDDALARAEQIERRNLPLLAALVILILALFAVLLWLERKASGAAVAESEAHAMRLARDRAELVNHELNHRVKNLFAVIISMIRVTARQPLPPQVAFNSLRDRIHALSLAHAVSLGDIHNPVAALEDLLRATLAPYDPKGDRIGMSGNHLLIPAKFVTPVGLILHELATNAVKYGALQTDKGRLDIAWNHFDHEGNQRIRLVWSESCVSRIESPEAGGFGSTMIQASTRQIGGEIHRTWGAGGLQLTLEFPAEETSQ